MGIELEFELDKGKSTNGLTQYNINRKGLCIGILVIDKEPYNDIELNKMILKK